MKHLIFHNAADDSYMNSAKNFRGAYAATETVDIYFKAAAVGNSGDSTGYDKIVVACTNGEEDRAVEELANAMTKNSSVITIADDVNSVYACQNITSVTSITKNNAGNALISFTLGASTTYATSPVFSVGGTNCSSGCTDGSVDSLGNYIYTNYDANAVIDDGSCVTTLDGCTDPAAVNYNQ